MSKVDWSLAPEGATHYCDGAMSGFWRDLSERTWKFFRDSDRTWHDSGDKTSSLMHNSIGLTLIPRPQPKPWSGPEDGLPPVNSIVLAQRSDTNKWHESEVLRHNTKSQRSGVCAFMEVKSNMMFWSGEYKAIKTPSQIAADNRNNQIREIMDAAGIDCLVTATRLVDAGFKR